MSRADWQSALHKFLDPWRQRREVTGALVCGSFVTGDPSPRSDIDLHILLSPRTKWRERGNRFIDGFHIEYFASPPSAFANSFRRNYAENDHATATQLLTGRVLFDHRGDIAKLKRQAKQWLNKPFRRPNRQQTEHVKYALWDQLDNFCDACERQAVDLSYGYFYCLYHLLHEYARYTGDCFSHEFKTHAYLTSDALTRKYLQKPFSDPIFGRSFAAAMVETEPKEMRRRLEALTRYVQRKMGGFEIDGFCLRRKLTKGGIND